MTVSVQESYLCRNVFSNSFPRNGLHVTLPPPRGCSSQVAYQCISVPSFLRFLLVTSHLPSNCLFFFFLWWLLFNCYHCSRFKAACPKRFPDKMPVDPGVSPSYCVSVSNTEGKTVPSGQCSHISGYSYAKAASRFFCHFGGG
jgi:hypothetical protein